MLFRCYSNGVDSVSGHVPQDNGGATHPAHLRGDHRAQDQPHLPVAGGCCQLFCYSHCTVPALPERDRYFLCQILICFEANGHNVGAIVVLVIRVHYFA